MSDNIQQTRENYLDLIDSTFSLYDIDIYELGADDLGSEYRNSRPGNCDCYGILSPDDEMEYYISHINMCCNEYMEVYNFCKQFESFIEKHGKRFREKKEEVLNRLKEKGKKSEVY